MRTVSVAAAALLAGLMTSVSGGALAQERTVKITGFGAKSGVVRVFGVNSEAAMKAAAEEINKAGGVVLGDGTKAKLSVEFLDDRCNAEEGISVIRRIASSDAFVAVGPTCSNVAESLFGILPPTAACNFPCSRTSLPKAASPRFPSGRFATSRASSRCTSRCSRGSRRSIPI
jgi:branched-chain amino acid transport system substrate-binding protein